MSMTHAHVNPLQNWVQNDGCPSFRRGRTLLVQSEVGSLPRIF